MTHATGATSRLIFMMKYDTSELLAEHSIRLEMWLNQTLLDIDENCPPLMFDFQTERARMYGFLEAIELMFDFQTERARMYGFLEAIELMCDDSEYQKAKQDYENMCDTIEKIIQRTEPKGIL